MKKLLYGSRKMAQTSAMIMYNKGSVGIEERHRTDSMSVNSYQSFQVLTMVVDLCPSLLVTADCLVWTCVSVESINPCSLLDSAPNLATGQTIGGLHCS